MLIRIYKLDKQNVLSLVAYHFIALNVFFQAGIIIYKNITFTWLNSEYAGHINSLEKAMSKYDSKESHVNCQPNS